MSSSGSTSSANVRFLSIDSDSEGQRLDNYLIRQLKGVPKSKIYRIIRKGEVRVNKGRCKPETKLRSGDQVRVPPIRLEQNEGGQIRVPESLLKTLNDSVLFEDDGLLVINKPAGLAVHGGSGLSFGVIEILRAARPEQRFLELVHRLDRDTSGVLMLAKKRRVLVQLHNMLQNGRVNKIYQAWVVGRWPKHKTEVTAPLRKNSLKSGERMVIVSQDGKPSETLFDVLYVGDGHSLVQARPITGRTHQIRVHAQFAGHPIIGDEKYCPDESLKHYKEKGVRRMCLHARALELRWPDRPMQRIDAPWEMEYSPLLRDD
ncbi:23S rRNA pseudouridine(955/2504/2580) synthase RluC [Hahella ganghwensis]|uniref:23S rRNA pseudouridine(955/2504/2580) synthase RluC n=1 Tax=Hahella ganghwensis TaxID=286420 RepID=UPI000A062CAA|nr:23S rRNA pseudouridine(955/2504/2580) synthase RluC [Hahella ganghwensis]